MIPPTRGMNENEIPVSASSGVVESTYSDSESGHKSNQTISKATFGAKLDRGIAPSQQSESENENYHQKIEQLKHPVFCAARPAAEFCCPLPRQ